MSYSYTFDIHLGAIYGGLVLAAQLVDTAGNAVGSEIDSGFVEIGSNGDYLLTATIPDGHRGGVLVYEAAAPGAVLAAGAINPEDAENQVAGTGGALSYSDTVLDPEGVPLDGVLVRLSTDDAGENTVDQVHTDTFGVFMFTDLTAGTYFRWMQLSGYTFAQGVEVTVS